MSRPLRIAYGGSFSAVKNGKPGEGFPDPVPADFHPVYMVPEGRGFKTFDNK